jgi:hypothetical protein
MKIFEMKTHFRRVGLDHHENMDVFTFNGSFRIGIYDDIVGRIKSSPLFIIRTTLGNLI